MERDGKTLLPQFLGMYRYHHHALALVHTCNIMYVRLLHVQASSSCTDFCTYNSMYIRLTVDNVENYMCVMRNVFSGHLKVRNLRR